MRSKDFSFIFAENVSKFVILRRNIRKVRSFCKFCRISLNVQRAKTEFKIAGAWELGHLELDMKVTDTGMETAESNDCREMSKNNRDANSVLAAMQEEARFSCKDRQKFIDPFTQSISGLCWASQLYPRTKEQEESSRVT